LPRTSAGNKARANQAEKNGYSPEKAIVPLRGTKADEKYIAHWPHA